MAEAAYAYLLLCADGSFYAGWTYDPEKRLKAHNSGRGAKYTRSRLPVSFAMIETFEDRSSAMRRECELKRLSHKEKEVLCAKKDSLF